MHDQVLKDATREYLDTWKPDKPEPSETKPATEDRPLAEELGGGFASTVLCMHAAVTPGMQNVTELPHLHGAAGIARAGAGSAQPLLQHLYRTRAAAYRDAIREFVEGYRCARQPCMLHKGPCTMLASATTNRLCTGDMHAGDKGTHLKVMDAGL